MRGEEKQGKVVETGRKRRERGRGKRELERRKGRAKEVKEDLSRYGVRRDSSPA